MTVENTGGFDLLYVDSLRQTQNGYIQDILTNGLRVSNGNTPKGVGIYRVPASNPHINSAHEILWMLGKDRSEYDWKMLLDNKDLIENLEVVINEQSMEFSNGTDQRGNIIGINIGHPKQFDEQSIGMNSRVFQNKSGLQSIPGVHIHLIKMPPVIRGLKQEFQVDNEAMFFKRYDFSGEATTRFYHPAVDIIVQEHEGIFTNWSMGGVYDRTVIEFDKLIDAIDAGVSLQYMVEETWKDLDLEELYYQIADDVGIDKESFLSYGKQIQTPGMLIAKRGTSRWLLVPFSAGISAAEFFGGYALARNYNI